MKKVIIESPYSGDVVRNTDYARACLLDSLKRGEAPFASHLLYTQVLNDLDEYEREMGMKAGFVYTLKAADLVAVYTDLGISNGMEAGITMAEMGGVEIEYRTLEGWE